VSRLRSASFGAQARLRSASFGAQGPQSPISPRSGERFLSREQAKALADRVLALSNADETRVNIESTWNGDTRFAGAQITTSGDVTDTSLTVSVTIGKRRASASTNTLDEDSLKRTVELAIRLARLSPEDPELMAELGSQSYSRVNAFIQRTADLTGDARSAAVERAIEAAMAAGRPAGETFVAGFLQAHAGMAAVATSRGLFAYHRSTDADLSLTVRTPDGTGSGWASAGARDWAGVDVSALGRIAAQKALASRNPQTLEPGMHTVVLEPQAVNDLIPLLSGSFNARNADEGRSPFSRKGGGVRIGEKVVDERVTLSSDPADPDLLGQPFDAEGLPVRRHVWIEKGILKNLAYSRFWAQKQGKEPTGGGFAGGLRLAGGTRSTDDLIAGCQRGVLVTHFFYIRSLDPRTALFTGLTRDGTFLIERGKITHALKNFRWNESPLLMLGRLEEIGRAERAATGRVMPALRVKDFNFTSLSDAV
jgi:predicted Zn-dependent protease